MKETTAKLSHALRVVKEKVENRTNGASIIVHFIILFWILCHEALEHVRDM